MPGWLKAGMRVVRDVIFVDGRRAVSDFVRAIIRRLKTVREAMDLDGELGLPLILNAVSFEIGSLDDNDEVRLWSELARPRIG